MYLIILYVFVYFIHGVDLRYPSRRDVLDGAAETARLINLIQKFDKIEERNPPYDKNHGNEDNNAQDLEYESMKLLQKNYDIARKFNERINHGDNVQYIRNPEILAEYKNLPEEHTEVYDDISDQANTQRSYARELERMEKLAIHEMRNSRRNGHIKARNIETDDSDSDSSSDNSNDASDDDATRAHDNRRTKAEDQNPLNADTSENNSKEIKESNLKSRETFNLLKPIIEQMLSKYTVKNSKEKDERIEIEAIDANKESIKEKQKIHKQFHNKDNFDEKRFNNKKRGHKPKERIAVLGENENKLNMPIKKKDTERLSSNGQRKKKKKNILLKKQRDEIIFTKDNLDLTKESISKNEKFDLDPKITIEVSKSEEIQGGLNEKRKKEQINGSYDKWKSKTRNKNRKEKKIDRKKKIEKRIIKEISSKENENKKTLIEMDETVIDWADYDGDNKAGVQHSKINDKDSNKNKESEKSVDSTEKYDKPVDSKKISTRRKGDDNCNDKYDTENKKDSSNNKKQDWSKTEDDNSGKKKELNKKDRSWDEKDDQKKKDIDWSKEDWSKENDWNKKDNGNKKGEAWNKKKDNWNKKNDNWDKKNVDWDTKEEGKIEKKKNWDTKDDTESKTRFKKTKNTPQRDTAWDSVGADKKQNAGWGNYDSFKNIRVQDKTNDRERDHEKRIAPKAKKPAYESWNRPSARDDYYEKPRKHQGRQSPFRTSIPFVGKKAVYAD